MYPVVLWVVFMFLLTLLGVSNNYWSNCFYGSDECPNNHVQFWLFKNETRNNPDILDPINLTWPTFAPANPLKVIVHGFNANRDHSPNAEIRSPLLQTQKVHVISVDYALLTQPNCYYPWSVSNARIVAKCLAQLVDNLIDVGIYRSEDIHLIGFSLGSHIVGLTANYVKYPLKRITGLDPARPAFMTGNLNDKLDATDAEFVDVIHTDPALYGLIEPIGHVDFYPNLQHLRQLGCSLMGDDSQNYKNIFFCNHMQAPIFYAESITTAVGFWAYSCNNWLAFLMQQCANEAHIPDEKMGYFVSVNATGSYFLTTNAKAPFAKGPVVDIELEVAGKS